MVGKNRICAVARVRYRNTVQVRTNSYLPVPKPIVSINVSILSARMLIKMQTVEIMLPAIVTGLQPNLFTSALAIGPVKYVHVYESLK